MIQEIDNFFHILQYKSLNEFIKNSGLHWKFYPYPALGKKSHQEYYSTSTIVKDHPTFIHNFYRRDLPKQTYDFDIYSLFYNKLANMYNSKIKIIRIQGNIGVPCPNYSHQHGCPHVDWEIVHHNTLIYYLNTIDGDTVFFDEMYPEFQENNVKNIYRKLSPKENKAVIFDGYRYHAASPSKTDLRYNINVNFIIQNPVT